MAGKWENKRIEEIATKVGMGPFGSSIKVSTFVPAGIPVISGQHLRGTSLEDNVYNFVTADHAERLKNSLVYRGDIIFTHAGNIGQVAYIPEDSFYDKYIISQRQFYMRCDREKVIPEFVTYYFKTAEGQHKLLANRSSSGVPSIAQPVTYLRSIPIPVPPLPEQRAIAHILGSLDDKIELNRQMNATLQAIAQALFTSWFVDFDPVHARAAGQQPLGLSPEIADLFPDSFVESEIGLVPKGWGVVTLPEVIDVNPQRSLSKGTISPYLEMKNVSNTSARVIAWANREYSSGMRFINGDVLMAPITPCLENGKTAFVDFLANEQVGWGSTEYLVFRSKPPLPPEFAYFLACSDIFREYAIRNMSGTTGRQRVPATCFDRFLLAIPPAEIMNHFAATIANILPAMKAHDEESNTLIAIRDGLLPKLLSGEVQVYEIENDAKGCN